MCHNSFCGKESCYASFIPVGKLARNKLIDSVIMLERDASSIAFCYLYARIIKQLRGSSPGFSL